MKQIFTALSCSGILATLLVLSTTTTHSATSRYWQFYSQTGSGFNIVCHFRRSILNNNGQSTGEYEYYNLPTTSLVSCVSSSVTNRLPI